MKRAIKFIAANTFVAVLSSLISCFIFLVIVIGIIGAFAQKQHQFLPSEAVLELDLSMNLTDTPPSMTLENLIGQMANEPTTPHYHLMNLAATLNRAANDHRIKALLISGNFQPAGYGCSYPVLQEFKSAIAAFKTSGKPVIAYSVYPTLRELYVMGVADERWLNASGGLELSGLHSEPMFFSQALSKMGIGVQAVRVGDYKSAIEVFTRTELSQEAREAHQVLLDDLWKQLLSEISGDRTLDQPSLADLVARRPFLNPEKALESGLVSNLGTHSQLIERLQELASKDENTGGYAAITLADYLVEQDQFASAPTGDGVAVVYAEGEIVGGYGEPDQIGADRLITTLREVRNQDSVKAVVLRVNSPGGGATASRLIQDELQAIRDSGLPLVVSMGGYAASGGYLISQSADHIFALPHTVTGSIGIFGLLFNIEKGAEKLGVTFDSIKTASNADINGMAKPKSDAQLSLIQEELDAFYIQWIQEGASLRNLSEENFKAAASGRVWSGKQALELGLVDAIGGLDDAVEHAAQAAGLEHYSLYEFPRKQTPEEAIANALGIETAVKAGARAAQPDLLKQSFEWLKRIESQINGFNDPKGAYALNPLRYE
jgi:protease-4